MRVVPLTLVLMGLVLPLATTSNDGHFDGFFKGPPQARDDSQQPISTDIDFILNRFMAFLEGEESSPHVKSKRSMNEMDDIENIFAPGITRQYTSSATRQQTPATSRRATPQQSTLPHFPLNPKPTSRQPFPNPFPPRPNPATSRAPFPFPARPTSTTSRAGFPTQSTTTSQTGFPIPPHHPNPPGSWPVPIPPNPPSNGLPPPFRPVFPNSSVQAKGFLGWKTLVLLTGCAYFMIVRTT